MVFYFPAILVVALLSETAFVPTSFCESNVFGDLFLRFRRGISGGTGESFMSGEDFGGGGLGLSIGHGEDTIA